MAGRSIDDFTVISSQYNDLLNAQALGWGTGPVLYDVNDVSAGGVSGSVTFWNDFSNRVLSPEVKLALTKTALGIPVWVWLIVAAFFYFYIMRK